MLLFEHAAEGMSQSQGWTCTAPFPWCMPLPHYTLCMISSTHTNSNPLLALSSFRLGKCCCFYSSCQSLASCKTICIYVWQSASSLETPTALQRAQSLPGSDVSSLGAHMGTCAKQWHNWGLHSKARGCENNTCVNWSEWLLTLHKPSHLAILKSCKFSLH